MEPNFKVSATYDAESYNQLVAVQQQLYQKSPKKFVYLATGLFAVLWGSQISTGQPLVDWAMRILLLVIAMVLVPPCHKASQKGLRKMMVRRLTESTGESAPPVSYLFSKEQFVMADCYGESQVSYGEIQDCAETEDYYFLLFGSQSLCYLLPKSAFQLGAPEEFRAFLQERCQRPVPFYQVDETNKKA